MGIFTKKQRTLSDMYADKKRADASFIKARNKYGNLSKRRFPRATSEVLDDAKSRMDHGEALCKSLSSEIEHAEMTR